MSEHDAHIAHKEAVLFQAWCRLLWSVVLYEPSFGDRNCALNTNDASLSAFVLPNRYIVLFLCFSVMRMVLLLLLVLDFYCDRI
jgi:hypothetical protein